MNNNDKWSDEEAILFQSYPSANYYVQSPSTNMSHANNLSGGGGYSSSRGSNNPFPEVVNKKINVKDHEYGHDVDEEEEWHYGSYLSFGRSTSCLWFCVQIGWRLMVSLGVALFVFYILTNPPPPIVSLEIARIRPFGLGEGVDSSGVSTKILSCNCSMEVIIENKSKLFGLHISPLLIDMSFGRLPLAFSHLGREEYAESEESKVVKMWVATMRKPMYGAGTRMQELLESGDGLPLTVRVSLNSHFRVVWKLINPMFEHQARCLVLLHGAYDKKHRTQMYNTTCALTSSY